MKPVKNPAILVCLVLSVLALTALAIMAGYESSPEAVTKLPPHVAGHGR